MVSIVCITIVNVCVCALYEPERPPVGVCHPAWREAGLSREPEPKTAPGRRGITYDRKSDVISAHSPITRSVSSNLQHRIVIMLLLPPWQTKFSSSPHTYTSL